MNKKTAMAALALGCPGTALAAAPACELTGLQVAAGYVTLANTVMFLCSLGGFIFLSMFLYHLRYQFARVPVAVWKGLGYAVVVALCASSWWLSADAAAYAQFVGAALGVSALATIMYDVAEMTNKKVKDGTILYAGVVLLGGLLAVYQQNAMVAGVAVLGLMALLGFTAFSGPGMVGMGFEGRESLWRAVAGALTVLVPAALYRAAFGAMGPLDVFWPAIGWFCTGVAGIGLLIGSARYFQRHGRKGYVLSNVGMLAFVGFCLWCGTVHGMVEMQRVAGTLAVMWLFEKPWDIRKSGVLVYSFLGAATCLGMFLLAREIAQHPERWSRWLLF